MKQQCFFFLNKNLLNHANQLGYKYIHRVDEQKSLKFAFIYLISTFKLAFMRAERNHKKISKQPDGFEN